MQVEFNGEKQTARELAAKLAERPTSTSYDAQHVKCPWCHHMNDWTDDAIDGALVEGKEDTCTECGKGMKVRAVDWEPTIYLEGI